MTKNIESFVYSTDLNEFLLRQLDYLKKYIKFDDYFFRKPKMSVVCEKNTSIGTYEYIIIIRYVYLFYYYQAIKRPFVLLFFPQTLNFKGPYLDNIRYFIANAMLLSEQNDNIPVLIPIIAGGHNWKHASSCVLFKCDYGWNQIWIDTSGVSRIETHIYLQVHQQLLESFKIYKQEKQQSSNNNTGKDVLLKMKYSNCSKNFQGKTTSCAGVSTVLSTYFLYYVKRYSQQFCSPTRMTKFCKLFQQVNTKHFENQFMLFNKILYFIDTAIYDVFRTWKSTGFNNNNTDDFSNLVLLLSENTRDIGTISQFRRKIMEKNIFHALKIKNPKKFSQLVTEPQKIRLNRAYKNDSPSDNEETEPESEDESYWFNPDD